jgi:FlaA1/EpsC-like NDP-sugar epimerase
VIGAAGSIGGAFTKLIAGFSLKTLHLVDLSENNLAEIVRDLRSSNQQLPEDFKTFAISFDGPEFEAYLRSDKPFDYVLNFCALKHVRSERDPFSLLRLLRVNVLANQHMMDCLVGKPVKRLFAVSSDKAVAPASLMGASKAFMERVFLVRGDEFHFNSARFANVAFSDGSLLHGFNQRIQKRQPLSAPNDVRRFFITHLEAAQLCLLAFALGERNEIFHPKLDPTEDLQSFADIAEIYLEERGLSPVQCQSETDARDWFNRNPTKVDTWPCHFSNSNTSGEKMYEEFVGVGEETDEERFSSVGVVSRPVGADPETVLRALEELAAVSRKPAWEKAELVDIVKWVVPELEHVETHKHLDQKM